MIPHTSEVSITTSQFIVIKKAVALHAITDTLAAVVIVDMSANI